MNHTLFAVCPHDTARGFDKWALLNTRVNKHFALGSRFHAYLDFAEFGRDLASGRFLWAYLNPADFLKARATLGYVAVARPRHRFDVARIIARTGTPPSAIASGAKTAAVPGYLAGLVEHDLRARGVVLERVPAKSYAEVMVHVRERRAELGITYNEHFDATAASSREGLEILANVDAGLAHVLVAHPSLGARIDDVRAWLLDDPEGSLIGSDLGIVGWERLPEEPYQRLAEAMAAP